VRAGSSVDARSRRARRSRRLRQDPRTPRQPASPAGTAAALPDRRTSCPAGKGGRPARSSGWPSVAWDGGNGASVPRKPPRKPAGSPEDLPASDWPVADFGPRRAGSEPTRSQDRRGSETSGEDRALAESRPTVQPPRRPRVRQSGACLRRGFNPASESRCRSGEAARLAGVCRAATAGASAQVGG
jgi:hypothetical protein